MAFIEQNRQKTTVLWSFRSSGNYNIRVSPLDNLKASPMALADVAHAVTTHSLKPLAPNCMAICPAAMFEIIMG